MTEEQIISHTNAILKTLTGDPLPIDSDLTLWQVYVTPSAKYWENKIRDKKTETEAKHIPNIIESLRNTVLASADPIIIHGQPGHGKTSTVLMLTHTLLEKEKQEKPPEKTYILMYEFKNLGRLDENEIRILSLRTPFIQSEDFFYGKSSVVILDGMDERQITDGADIALKDFIRHLFHLSAEVNSREDSKFNLILTGRSQFVRQIQPSFSGDYHLYEIEDFSKAQVETWLKKYCEQKRVKPVLQYEDFVASHLEDLIHQPILLTIAAMMFSDTEGRQLMGDLQKEQISRGDIYRTIIRWTYLKKWQRHPNRSHLPDEKTYNRFLRTVAFILFRRGQESIKIGALIEALKKENTLYGLDVVELKNEQQIEDICRTLAVSFFFKELEENAFSFIHKTIKDYLTAEAFFDLLKETTEIFRTGRPEKSCDMMAGDLYFIFGGVALSPDDHIPFLQDVIAARNSDAKELFTPLETFFKLALSHVYLLKHESGRNADPLKTEANLLSALLHWLTEIFSFFPEEEKKKRYPDGTLRLFENNDDFYKFVSFLNASEQGNFSKHRFNLRGFNLSKAALNELSLSSVNISEADLRYANLCYANLLEADMRGANLSGADLSYATLWGANLSGANLILANMIGADLSGANLSGANLSGANLLEANLNGANLSGANLSGADLSDADVSYADVSYADVSFIDLTHTDLKDADLSKANLSYANLSKANLSKANLSGANLNGADLEGANLNGTNLRKTKLREARELTRKQLERAVADDTTELPEYLNN